MVFKTILQMANKILYDHVRSFEINILYTSDQQFQIGQEHTDDSIKSLCM